MGGFGLNAAAPFFQVLRRHWTCIWVGCFDCVGVWTIVDRLESASVFHQLHSLFGEFLCYSASWELTSQTGGDFWNLKSLLESWKRPNAYVHNLNQLHNAEDYAQMHCSDLDYLARTPVWYEEPKYDSHDDTARNQLNNSTVPWCCSQWPQPTVKAFPFASPGADDSRVFSRAVFWGSPSGCGLQELN